MSSESIVFLVTAAFTVFTFFDRVAMSRFMKKVAALIPRVDNAMAIKNIHHPAYTPIRQSLLDQLDNIGSLYPSLFFSVVGFCIASYNFIMTLIDPVASPTGTSLLSVSLAIVIVDAITKFSRTRNIVYTYRAAFLPCVNDIIDRDQTHDQ